MRKATIMSISASFCAGFEWLVVWRMIPALLHPNPNPNPNPNLRVVGGAVRDP